MPTLKAMKKKVARKLRSAKKNVRKLSVRLNKLRRKTSHGKKKHKRRRKRTRRRGRSKKGGRQICVRHACSTYDMYNSSPQAQKCKELQCEMRR